MGMYAEVIAIGPFSWDLLDSLEYSKAHYEGTVEGAIVNQTLFGIGQGTTTGREFAACLGITNGWDFNQHKINPTKINHEALIDFIKRYDEYESDYEAFIAFLEKGFEFHFSPNG